MNRLLDILIPTLNREDSLIKNLRLIEQILSTNRLCDDIGIIISDNGSTEASFAILKNYIEKNCRIQCSLFRQKYNIGVEKNVLFLISQSEAKYVMTLGDDDYFTEEFLLHAMDYLKSGKYAGIISNPYPIDSDGNKIGQCRDAIKEDRIYDKTNLWICDRGHQLSCLIFLRDGVVEAYKKNVRSNVYPFVYFMAYSIQRGEIIHITKNPYAVSMIPQKNWDYSSDNLMGEIAVVFDCLPYQDERDKKHQLYRMIMDNAYRYCNKDTYFHAVKVFNMIMQYDVSPLVKKVMIKVFLVHWLLLPLRVLVYISKNINRMVQK